MCSSDLAYTPRYQWNERVDLDNWLTDGAYIEKISYGLDIPWTIDNATAVNGKTKTKKKSVSWSGPAGVLELNVVGRAIDWKALSLGLIITTAVFILALIIFLISIKRSMRFIKTEKN